MTAIRPDAVARVVTCVKRAQAYHQCSSCRWSDVRTNDGGQSDFAVCLLDPEPVDLLPRRNTACKHWEKRNLWLLSREMFVWTAMAHADIYPKSRHTAQRAIEAVGRGRPYNTRGCVFTPWQSGVEVQSFVRYGDTFYKRTPGCGPAVVKAARSMRRTLLAAEKIILAEHRAKRSSDE